MTALHQLLAVKQGVRARAQQALTKFYHQVQKTEPFSGISKRYTPKDEEGETFPGEFNRVQLDAQKLLKDVKEALLPMYKVTADTDATNQVAKANIVVGEVTVATDVPVATLLWLEKQLADLSTVISKIPVLDPQHEWTRNPEQGVWTTAPMETVRSKKVPRNHVKARATDKHPEQVEVFFEDVTVGTWSTQKLSGAMRAMDVQILQNRVAAVRDAVKVAREEANRIDAVSLDISGVLHFVIGGPIS